jgi:Uma2 family endonuclease
MATSVATKETSITALKPPKVLPIRLTLADFYAQYDSVEDGFKYEFNNGLIEKTNAMKFNELYIYSNLLFVFYQTTAFQKRDVLVAELNQKTGIKKIRKPDIAYIKAENIKKDRDVMSEFVVEIISDNEEKNHVSRKIREYFNAGVKVFWIISPEFDMVEVYTSPKDVRICIGEDVCSATLAIDGFEITAADVFRK